MKVNAKKVSLIVVGGFIGLLLIAGILGQFLPSDDKATSAEEYHDQKLEDLRERSAELDDVYEGDSQVADAPEAGENPFADKGSLSDFDAMPEEEQKVSKNDGVDADANLEAALNQEPEDVQVVEPEPVDDDLGNEAGGGLEGSSFSDTISLTAEEVDDIAVRASERASLNMASKAEIIELDGELRQKIHRLNQKVDEIPDLIKREANALNTGEESSDLSADIEALAGRIEAIETKNKSQRKKAAHPSSATLQNLYRLSRIEGSTAVLIGQNTGRTYRFAQGDSLAYGGTLTGINGDSVTLRWSNTQTTLSLY